MAVKIRLKRMGAKKRPYYRLVVADSRAKRDGNVIESIGTYMPLEAEKYNVNKESALNRQFLRKPMRSWVPRW